MDDKSGTLTGWSKDSRTIVSVETLLRQTATVGRSSNEDARTNDKREELSQSRSLLFKFIDTNSTSLLFAERPCFAYCGVARFPLQKHSRLKLTLI